jgi:hypothetical protein
MATRNFLIRARYAKWAYTLARWAHFAAALFAVLNGPILLCEALGGYRRAWRWVVPAGLDLALFTAWLD